MVKFYIINYMVLVNTTIKEFNNNNYGPTMKKLDFRLPRFTILGKNHCGKKRCEDFEIKHVFV